MFFKKSTEKNFLSDNEYNFFKELLSFLSRNYHTKYYLCPQVRIADVCNLKRSLIKHYGSIDFLICDFEKDMKPILAIELNGPEHYRWFWRRNSDSRKRKILKRNNIPLITIKNEELDNFAPVIYKIDHTLKEKSIEDFEHKEVTHTNIIQQQKVEHENAYNIRTNQDDNSLKELYRKGKSIPELMEIFHRNRGGIISRLKKLGLLA